MSLRNERGIALVMALLVLFAISLLSVALMLTLSIETKIAGHSVRYAQAMNLAEAGVGEALARIRNEDIPGNLNLNPRMTAQVFLAVAGSAPPQGADSLSLVTGQVAGQWLNYTTAGKGPDALTVTYKTDAARTVIYRYDPNLPSPINYTTGLPIFVVTATGRKGQEFRRVRTEVVQKPFNINVQAAMACQKGIDFGGNSSVCGYNHNMETTAYTDGVHDNNGPCRSQGWEITSGDLPGSYSTENVTSTGSANQSGTPITNKDMQPTFYNGPWEALGLGQAEFFSWVGSPLTAMPAPPVGVNYLDNNGLTQDQSGDFAVHGGNGEGLLYVDGDLSINGNFTFRGMVYVEGDLKVNGNAWILGGLIVKGKERIKISNGDLTVLYSKDAISLKLARFGGQFTTLSWQEITN